MDHIFLGLLVSEGLIATAMAVCAMRLCLRLERHHHELFVSLGRPMLGGRRTATEYLRFLRLRQYNSLSDGTTRRLARYARTANKAFLAFTFAASGTVFAIIVVHKYMR